MFRRSAAALATALALGACTPGQLLRTPDHPGPVHLDLLKQAEEEAMRMHREAVEAALRFQREADEARSDPTPP